MRVTINGKDPGWAMQGLLQRLLRSDPNQKLQNGDTDITEAEARALLDQDSDQDIDEQDLQKINQGFTTQNEQMAAADLATLAETFQRSFPKNMMLETFLRRNLLRALNVHGLPYLPLNALETSILTTHSLQSSCNLRFMRKSPGNCLPLTHSLIPKKR